MGTLLTTAEAEGLYNTCAHVQISTVKYSFFYCPFFSSCPLLVLNFSCCTIMKTDESCTNTNWRISSYLQQNPTIAPFWICWVYDYIHMTGMGRFENTIFFLTMPTTLHFDETEWSAGEPMTMASSPRSGPGFPVRRITANGFGRAAIVPSKRWCPMSRLGLPCTKIKTKKIGNKVKSPWLYEFSYFNSPLNRPSSVSPLVFHSVRWGCCIQLQVILVIRQGRPRHERF